MSCLFLFSNEVKIEIEKTYGQLSISKHCDEYFVLKMKGNIRIVVISLSSNNCQILQVENMEKFKQKETV